MMTFVNALRTLAEETPMHVFIAIAEKAHDTTQIIGAFHARDEAVRRCTDRVYAGDVQESAYRYDRHYIEEWEIGGIYLRTYDVDIATGATYEHD